MLLSLFNLSLPEPFLKFLRNRPLQQVLVIETSPFVKVIPQF